MGAAGSPIAEHGVDGSRWGSELTSKTWLGRFHRQRDPSTQSARTAGRVFVVGQAGTIESFVDRRSAHHSESASPIAVVSLPRIFRQLSFFKNERGVG